MDNNNHFLGLKDDKSHDFFLKEDFEILRHQFPNPSSHPFIVMAWYCCMVIQR